MENINCVEKQKCTGCAACLGSCPRGAIVMKRSDKGFLYPEVNRSLCVLCGLCVRTCSINAEQKNRGEQEIYAFSHRNLKIKSMSSSGGAFSWIAEYVIKARKGVVYGAVLDKNGEVRHVRINAIKDLHKIRGSKYVQSNIADSYSQIREDLDKGIVLVSGTPCQIAGIKSVFGKHKNLLTCDVLCFGVSSPSVFRKYLDETIGKETIEYLNMRSKITGWKNYSMEIRAKSKNYKKSKEEDIFLKGFATKLFVRESCYNCQYHDINRVGDFSLGDYWGFCESFQKDSLRDDDTGISFLMVNSEKAKEIFSLLNKTEVCIEQRNIDGETLNWALQPTKMIPAGRDQFWMLFSSEGYTKAITPFLRKSAKKTVGIRVKEKIKAYYWIRFLLYKIKR